MRKTLLFLALFGFINLYGQGLMLNKDVDDIIWSNKEIDTIVNFDIKIRNDTIIYIIGGDYNNPTRIFSFKEDTCVSYTIVFHKRSRVAFYFEKLPCDIKYTNQSFFKRKTADEVKEIFLRVNKQKPLTEKQKQSIEEIRKEDMLLASRESKQVEDIPSSEELFVIDYVASGGNEMFIKAPERKKEMKIKKLEKQKKIKTGFLRTSKLKREPARKHPAIKSSDSHKEIQR